MREQRQLPGGDTWTRYQRTGCWESECGMFSIVPTIGHRCVLVDRTSDRTGHFLTTEAAMMYVDKLGRKYGR